MVLVSSSVFAQVEVDQWKNLGRGTTLWPQVGPTCSGGTALDGSLENGYRALSTADARFVQRLTPPTYPSGLTRVCACWIGRDPIDMPFNFLIYDDDGQGGIPGKLLGSVPSVVSIPTIFGQEFVGESCAFLDLRTESGGLYIGVQWDAEAYIGFFTCSDESLTTPPAKMYRSSNGGLNWLPVAGTVFPKARALSFRGEFVTLVDPAPPAGPWLTTSALPGYQFKSQIAGNRAATLVADCVPETLCLAGAIPTRAEAFVRIIGPRGNGFLWPEVIRFTVAQVELWIQKTPAGPINYYKLAGVSQDSDVLNGLVDREGFLP
jgi:hypothetical protein